MSALTACLGIGDPAEWDWDFLVIRGRFHVLVRLDHLEARARPAAAALAREHGLELVVTPAGVGLRLAGK